VNDQRHRWVTSAVMQSGTSKSGDGFFKHFIGDFTLSPIVEFSSGRPFNVITATDTRLDWARLRLVLPWARHNFTIHPGRDLLFASVCLETAESLLPFPPPIPGFPTISPPAGCDGSLGLNRFTSPQLLSWTCASPKRISSGERLQARSQSPTPSTSSTAPTLPRSIRFAIQRGRDLHRRPRARPLYRTRAQFQFLPQVSW